MKKAQQGPKQRSAFRDNNLAATMIAVAALLFSLPSLAQVDTTKVRQRINAVGYEYKNITTDSSLRIPRDTFKLRASDTGSLAYKDGILYVWRNMGDVIKWDTASGRSSGSSTVIGDSLSWDATTGFDPLVWLKSPTVAVIKAPRFRSYDTQLLLIERPTGTNTDSTLDYVFRLNNTAPLWATNRIFNIPIYNQIPTDGYVFTYNASTSRIEWRPPGGNDQWGTQTVAHNNTLYGAGTFSDPLIVDTINGNISTQSRLNDTATALRALIAAGGGSTETASEGLTKNANDIQFGNASSGSTTGELTADRYVPLGGRTLNFRNGRLSLQSSASAIAPLMLGNNGSANTKMIEFDRTGLGITNDIFSNYSIIQQYFEDPQPEEADSIRGNKVTTWGTNLSNTGDRVNAALPSLRWSLEENFVISQLGRSMEFIEAYINRSGRTSRQRYSLFSYDRPYSIHKYKGSEFAWIDDSTEVDVLAIAKGNAALFETPLNFYKVPDAENLVIKQATSGSVLRPLLGLSSDNSIRHGYGGTLHEFFGNNIYFEPVSTATRWAGNVSGMFRFNQDSLRFEANDGGQWRTFAWKSDITGGGGGGDGVPDADYGAFTVSAGVATLNSQVATFPKIQDISSLRILGRATSGSGVIEELQIQGPLDISTGFLKIDGNMSGNSTITANGNNWTFSNGANSFVMDAAEGQFIIANNSSTGGAEFTFRNNSGHKIQQFYTGSAWTYRDYGVKSFVTYNIQNNTAPFVIMDNDNVIVGTAGNNLVDDGQKLQVRGTTLLDGGLSLNVGSDATGDIYYRNASGVFTRLPIASDGDLLSIASGVPSYITKATLFTSPAFTGTPTAPTASAGSNNTQIANTAYVDVAVETAIAGGSTPIYATYTLNTDKTFSAANTAEVIPLDTENLESGVTHTGSSEEVSLPTAGVYIFTAQMHASSSGTDAVKFCLQKFNGDTWDNVANSSTVIPLLSSGAFPGGWTFHVNATANDRYRFVASASSTNVTLNAIAAADEVASVPAFRVTIHKL